MTLLSKFILLFLTTAIVLTGCGIPGSQVPTDHYYRLPSAQVAEKSDPLFERILIRPVQVEGLYHERSILYVEQNAPLEIKRYNYHYWVEAPSRLVKKYIVNYLNQSSIATTVSTTTIVQSASLQITPAIIGFERLVDNDEYKNLVTLRFDIQYANQQKAPWSNTYKVITESKSASMHDAAEGFGQALEQIMAQLVSDLSKK